MSTSSPNGAEHAPSVERTTVAPVGTDAGVNAAPQPDPAPSILADLSEEGAPARAKEFAWAIRSITKRWHRGRTFRVGICFVGFVTLLGAIEFALAHASDEPPVLRHFVDDTPSVSLESAEPLFASYDGLRILVEDLDPADVPRLTFALDDSVASPKLTWEQAVLVAQFAGHDFGYSQFSGQTRLVTARFDGRTIWSTTARLQAQARLQLQPQLDPVPVNGGLCQSAPPSAPVLRALASWGCSVDAFVGPSEAVYKLDSKLSIQHFEARLNGQELPKSHDGGWILSPFDLALVQFGGMRVELYYRSPMADALAGARLVHERQDMRYVEPLLFTGTGTRFAVPKNKRNSFILDGAILMAGPNVNGGPDKTPDAHSLRFDTHSVDLVPGLYIVEVRFSHLGSGTISFPFGSDAFEAVVPRGIGDRRPAFKTPSRNGDSEFISSVPPVELSGQFDDEFIFPHDLGFDFGSSQVFTAVLIVDVKAEGTFLRLAIELTIDTVRVGQIEFRVPHRTKFCPEVRQRGAPDLQWHSFRCYRAIA